MKPISISEQDVARMITVRKSIELARKAYLQRARKRVLEPPRSWFTLPSHTSFYFMPAHVFGLKTVSVKVVSTSPRSRKDNLPTTIATIYAFDSTTGLELARIAGNNLTAIRTAASSALATELLAHKNVDVLGIIGSGRQAQAHVPAMLEVREFSKVLVYSLSRAHRSRFARRVKRNHHVAAKPTNSAAELAQKSDVLVLATNSSNPLFDSRLVHSGAHVNAIGSALPSIREIDTALVKRSFLVVDSKEQALSSYGDIMIPLKEKAIRSSHVRAELGDLLKSPSGYKRRTGNATLFKAGGISVLDAVFADYVLAQFHPS